MASFAPRDTSRDVNPLFLSFMKRFGNSSDRHQGDGYSKANPLDVFAQKWGLGEDALRKLAELPIDLQDQAMSEFAPHEGVRDVNSKFVAFVKSKFQNRQQHRGADTRLDDFAQQWGLNEASMHQLTELPRDVQDEVMSTFAPHEDVRDVNSKFMSFVKSRFQNRQRHRDRGADTRLDDF